MSAVYKKKGTQISVSSKHGYTSGRWQHKRTIHWQSSLGLSAQASPHTTQQHKTTISFDPTTATAIRHNQPAVTFRNSILPELLCRSTWPRGLRRRSTVARLLGLRVRTHREHDCLTCDCCVLAGRYLFDRPIPRLGESYRVCNWV
jgi:hypothetical protein